MPYIMYTADIIQGTIEYMLEHNTLMKKDILIWAFITMAGHDHDQGKLVLTADK